MSDDVLVELDHDFKVYASSPMDATFVYQEIFQGGTYDHLELPARPEVVDVGAHIGLFLLFVKKLRPDARGAGLRTVARHSPARYGRTSTCISSPMSRSTRWRSVPSGKRACRSLICRGGAQQLHPLPRPEGAPEDRTDLVSGEPISWRSCMRPTRSPSTSSASRRPSDCGPPDRSTQDRRGGRRDRGSARDRRGALAVDPAGAHGGTGSRRPAGRGLCAPARGTASNRRSGRPRWWSRPS